ncbi:hypothetical protein [Ruegeria arenilitoris]|uniref:hypothetical protein n=1 Tax=Ruegeria arenilitoris TaxID=1173585 RepID=UPI00147C25EC|nr:hypothetical protein [Ruegeria arenilitoris]
MKPAFALSFSEHGISLHHQSDDEWYCIGTVPLDSPDLSQRIQALREQGFALANHLGCTLVLPTDQVRFLSVETDGLGSKAAEQKIQTTLADATPYDLSELSYATIENGEVTQVAAVARQTLNEAYEFAVSRGFVPESFCVGTASEDAFTGQAFKWGLEMRGSSDSSSVEDSWETVDGVGTDAPILQDEQTVDTEISDPKSELPVDDEIQNLTTDFTRQATEILVEEDFQSTVEDTADSELETPAEDDNVAATAEQVDPFAGTALWDETQSAIEETNEPEPELTGEITASKPTPTATESAMESSPKEIAPPSFDTAAETESDVQVEDNSETVNSGIVHQVQETSFEDNERKPFAGHDEKSFDALAEDGKETANSDVLETLPDQPDAKVEKTPIHAIAEPASPAAFRSAPQPVGKSTSGSWSLRQLAIPAIAALVCVGMAVGAWSILGPDPSPKETDTAQQQLDVQELDQTPEATPEVAAIVPEKSQPNIEAEPLAVAPDPAPESNGEGELSATDAAILEALKIEPEIVEDIATGSEPRKLFKDFTGSTPAMPSQLARPVLDELGDVYLSSIDRSDLSQDAIALPSVNGLDTDKVVPSIAQPPDAEESYELDERGLVTASPEGTLNPDGIMIYLGQPSSVPPETPARPEGEPAVDEIDERLAGFKPKLRPDNLVDQFERSQLGGRSREELAVVRPKLRPESLEVEPEIDYTPTALAVVRVPRPKLRPTRTAPQVASSPNAGTATLGSTANVAATDAVSADDEAGSFQPRTVSPKIPTTASVARQATIDNAINLRKLNLIGVYGTPANRRALVRLPSGRYKKLKVGDRIDGGKVVAIGDSELRYQKRGQNVTLKMPRG